MVTYKDAGVDIDAAEEAVSRIKKLARSTFSPAVLTDIGSFGGLFALDKSAYKNPVLVSSCDGVGTKLRMAWTTGTYDTVGQDLVNHCCNDIAVMGAKPLFFLDYIGTGKLKPDIIEQIIKGFSVACKQNNCALIGGEMAEMPGMYKPGEFDLVGTIVGVVEKDQIINSSSITTGDQLMGVASSGLHTNGYSLIYKIFNETELLQHKDALMAVHLSYVYLITLLLKKFTVKGMAHVTGSGIAGNLERILPKSVDARINRKAWKTPDVFQLIQKKGNVPDADMWQTYNMGIGLVVVVKKEDVSSVLAEIKKSKHQAYLIGEVVTGKGMVLI
ncbi:phosphoribosylformylglycinamidine cyclo-ligase [Candidatus Woesearchaeota archaeon]|nr:phosphoribosylformylglycinamidine cyclo-ligase [Candidatus Woesearchaeota archaeon]